ncbi:MAG: type II toxin-antitoxin system RelE/ParE family toxin [Ancrocorticia sp.]|uniref:type II toxin-antitoxin system RelE/ParE family toxin n=1 Tax=Ancrocorticia sp. TaxID=2593684 RepID=UPI003F8EB9CA
MSAYRLTPAAQHDLSSIWDFTKDHWSERQAETYVNEIRNAIERIAVDPSRGPACDEIRTGYRRYAIGSHLLFFVETNEGVDIIRILHQRMDSTRHIL